MSVSTPAERARPLQAPECTTASHTKNSRGSRPKNSSSAIPPEPITRARALGCFWRKAPSPESFPPRPLLTSNAHTRRPAPHNKVHLGVSIAPVGKRPLGTVQVVEQVRADGVFDKPPAPRAVAFALGAGKPARGVHERVVPKNQFRAAAALAQPPPGVLLQAGDQKRRAGQLQVVRKRGGVAGILQLAGHFVWICSIIEQFYSIIE